VLKTQEMLPASFNFQFQAPSRSSTAMIAAMVARAMITMGRSVGPIKQNNSCLIVVFPTDTGKVSLT